MEHWLKEVKDVFYLLNFFSSYCPAVCLLKSVKNLVHLRMRWKIPIKNHTAEKYIRYTTGVRVDAVSKKRLM